jgi:hypothetical protein
MLARLMEGPAKARYYFEILPTWSHAVLAAFGVPEAAIVLGPRPFFLHYRWAAMPSGTKNGFRLARPVNRMAWLELKSMLLSMDITAQERASLPGAERIFVSRRRWGTARPIGNATRLEEIAVNRGFVSVRPEEFSLPAQARIFNQARIVVGEDGSALHNIIFSDPGCGLGVISVPERSNLWHMAICQNLNHHLCYIGARIGDDGTPSVNGDTYNAMIDLLIGMAR